MNKKNKLAVASSAIALGVLGMGAFAFFTDSESEDVTAQIGTLELQLDTNINISHSKGLDNMNPGDNDHGQEDDSRRDGNDHQISFEVSNIGSKSAITRTIITVTGTDKDGNDITAADLKNVFLYESAYTKAAADTDTGENTLASLLLTAEAHEATATELIYCIGGYADESSAEGMKYVLNGTTGNEENETNAGDKISKTFDIGLDEDVPSGSPLYGGTLSFNVKIQAMQYRNTSDSTWETVFEDDVTVGVN